MKEIRQRWVSFIHWSEWMLKYSFILRSGSMIFYRSNCHRNWLPVTQYPLHSKLRSCKLIVVLALSILAKYGSMTGKLQKFAACKVLYCLQQIPVHVRWLFKLRLDVSITQANWPKTFIENWPLAKQLATETTAIQRADVKFHFGTTAVSK